MDFNQLVALGSLIIAAISLIVGFVARNKQAASRDQRIEDKLDAQGDTMKDVKAVVDKLDGKTDDHSVRIARIEGEVDNIYRRVDRLEGRCERHFGPSLHD